MPIGTFAETWFFWADQIPLAGVVPVLVAGLIEVSQGLALVSTGNCMSSSM